MRSQPGWYLLMTNQSSCWFTEEYRIYIKKYVFSGQIHENKGLRSEIPLQNIPFKGLSRRDILSLLGFVSL
jgi:hypothetical protein